MFMPLCWGLNSSERVKSKKKKRCKCALFCSRERETKERLLLEEQKKKEKKRKKCSRRFKEMLKFLGGTQGELEGIQLRYGIYVNLCRILETSHLYSPNQNPKSKLSTPNHYPF